MQYYLDPTKRYNASHLSLLLAKTSSLLWGNLHYKHARGRIMSMRKDCKD